MSSQYQVLEHPNLSNNIYPLYNSRTSEKYLIPSLQRSKRVCYHFFPLKYVSLFVSLKTDQEYIICNKHKDYVYRDAAFGFTEYAYAVGTTQPDVPVLQLEDKAHRAPVLLHPWTGVRGQDLNQPHVSRQQPCRHRGLNIWTSTDLSTWWASFANFDVNEFINSKFKW